MIQAMHEEAAKQEAAEWRRGGVGGVGAKTCGGQASRATSGSAIVASAPRLAR